MLCVLFSCRIRVLCYLSLYFQHGLQGITFCLRIGDFCPRIGDFCLRIGECARAAETKVSAFPRNVWDILFACHAFLRSVAIIPRLLLWSNLLAYLLPLFLELTPKLLTTFHRIFRRV